MISIRQIKTADDFTTFKDMQGDELHIVKMSAAWCGPCRILEDTILNLEPSRIGSTLFAEVDIDDENMEQVTIDCNIRSIPVLIYYKNGIEVDRTVGLVKAEDIYKKIESLK